MKTKRFGRIEIGMSNSSLEDFYICFIPTIAYSYDKEGHGIFFSWLFWMLIISIDKEDN